MTGVGALMRLILRRDRRILPIWVLYIGIITPVFGVLTNRLFPTKAALEAYAQASRSNPGFIALYTRLYGSSLGELTAWRMAFVPVVIGLVAILTVIRHTRTEEQAGRRELIGSTVVSRHADLTAAVLTTCISMAVLGAITGLGMTLIGLPATGSWLYGAGLATVGWVFAGIGAIAAQLTANAGSARGIAITVLGACYVLRAAGDVSGMSNGGLAWLSWLSPIGWAQRIRPFDQDQWWPIALEIGATVVLVLVAVALSHVRDIDTGLLPPRLGRAEAGPLLRSPLGLAWRLQHGLLAGWTVGFAVLGVVLGYLAASITSVISDSKSIETMFQRLGGATGLTNSYLAGMLGLFGMIAGGYAIQAMLRARVEETSGRLEPVLGTAVGRHRWIASHLVFALLGPAVVMLVGGLAMGITHGLNTHDVGNQVSRLMAGAAVQLPAVWVLAAMTALLFGLLPRLAAAVGWAGLVISMMIWMIGSAANLSHWIMDVSPFTHIPHLPGGVVSATPLIVLGAIVVVLIGVGAAGFRRRDVPIG